MTPAQEKMLTGPSYIDGWHNRDYLDEALELVEMGLLKMESDVSDQYTVYRFEPVAEPSV